MQPREQIPQLRIHRLHRDIAAREVGRQARTKRRIAQRDIGEDFEHQLGPGTHVRAQADVDGCLLRRLGVMRRTARTIEKIPGMQCKCRHRRPGRRRLPVVALTGQRQAKRGFIGLPPLGSCQLKNEDVVRVVMGFEPLRVGGRKVQIGLTGAAQLLFDAAAELRKGRHALLQLPERDRRPLIEQLVYPNGIDRFVLAQIVRRLYFPRMIHDDDLLAAQRGPTDEFIEGLRR